MKTRYAVQIILPEEVKLSEKVVNMLANDGFVEMSPMFFMAPSHFTSVETILVMREILNSNLISKNDVCDIRLLRVEEDSSMMELF